MTTAATVDHAQLLHDETRNLLFERIYAGLWIILIGNGLFALLDLAINREVLVPLWIIKGIEVAWIALVFAVIRHRPTTRRAINMAVLTVLVISLGAAGSSAFTGDLNSTPLLLMIISLGTATMLPWGMRAQIAVQLFAALGVFLNRYWVVPHETTVFAHVVVALAIGFIFATYATHTLDRYRAERLRAEEILKETRSRQHQAELAQAARLASLGEMAGGLAHELNQPLSAIVSYARGCALRIRADGLEPAAFLEVIEEISSQAFRAGEVLRRIREFLRHGDLQRESVDLNDLVREAIRFTGGEARELGILVQSDLATHALSVAVDKIQVERVVLNLMRNGFDAMQRMNAGERVLTIRTSDDGHGAAQVDVTDTGAGIAADHAARLFDPFFTTKRDGLGLGLSISRSIIEAHGGRLWADPHPNRGATFRFTLPLAVRTPDAHAA